MLAICNCLPSAISGGTRSNSTVIRASISWVVDQVSELAKFYLFLFLIVLVAKEEKSKQQQIKENIKK